MAACASVAGPEKLCKQFAGSRCRPCQLPDDNAEADGRDRQPSQADPISHRHPRTPTTGCPAPGTAASTTSSTWPGSSSSATTPPAAPTTSAGLTRPSGHPRPPHRQQHHHEDHQVNRALGSCTNTARVLLSIWGEVIRRGNDRRAAGGHPRGTGPQSATLETQVMMPYQSYQLWQAERATTAREQHAADARRGELAAALSRSGLWAGRALDAAAGLRPRRWRPDWLAAEGTAARLRAAE
jgi:hypothetical protein